VARTMLRLLTEASVKKDHLNADLLEFCRRG
jgi:hypothetical protein